MMGRMAVWVVVIVLLVGSAIYIARNATPEPQGRIEAPVTAGNAS